MPAVETASNHRYMQAMESIMNNVELRRELLWLRAMEKGRIEDARDMERTDPRVRERLAEVILEADWLGRRGARELYGREQDERVDAVLVAFGCEPQYCD
jgi:hypothetical protein